MNDTCDKEGNGTSKLTKYCKLIAVTLSIIIALAGAIIAVEDRYATATDLTKLQAQTMQTFEDFRAKLKNDDLHRKLTYLIERFYKVKDFLRNHPDDVELKEEYNMLKSQINDLKKKLNII